MKIKFIDQVSTYDGSQLRTMFSYQTHGLMGDSIVSWCGPCDVKNIHMKDGEDLFAGEKIYSENMLHFIVEIFEQNLRTAVTLQRLFSSIVKDCMEGLEASLNIQRTGDDLYLDGKKLSISIASVGPVSSMIHCGVNISSENTPVPTLGLQDLGIDHRLLADRAMQVFSQEWVSIREACQKVFPL